MAVSKYRVLADKDKETGSYWKELESCKQWIHRDRIKELQEVLQSGGLKVFEMPMPVRKEMLADWMGAGKAQGKVNQPAECASWYRANKDKMVLGPETRKWIEQRLGVDPIPMDD